MAKKMRRFLVRGKVTLDVSTIVDAYTSDQAEEEAICAVVAERVRSMRSPGATMYVQEASMSASEVPGTGGDCRS